MDTTTVSADPEELRDRLSLPDRSQYETARLTRRGAVLVVVLSSLGLWAAFWWAATSLVSARLW
jgi:hypothetical protein